MKNLGIILIIGVLFYFLTVSVLRNQIAKKRISKNFTMGEFMSTSVKNVLNIPNKKQQDNIKRLVDNILQPLRNYVNKPIIINSGFRSKEVNTAIGGALTSQHLKGEAADFYIKGLSNSEIISIIDRLNLPYDQLIDEEKIKSNGSKTRWIHVSLKDSNNRNEKLIARNSLENPTMKYTKI